MNIDPNPSAEGIFLSLVIPTFNEASNIASVIRRATKVLDECIATRYEIVIVDDNSSDDTALIVSGIAATNPAVQLLSRRYERGLASAVVRGWQHARGEVLAVMDGDGQHPADVLARVVASAQEGHSLVVASRHADGGGVSEWSAFRRAFSRSAEYLGLLANRRVVGSVSDPMSGFFAVRRDALDGVELEPLGYKILLEVLAKAHVKTVAEVPYVFTERTAGSSKVTNKVLVEYLHQLWILRRQDKVGPRNVGSKQTGVLESARSRDRMNSSRDDFNSQSTDDNEAFGGQDERAALAKADTFNDWIHRQVAPHLKGHVLEVGGGLGTMTSRLLADSRVSHVTSVEPDPTVTNQCAGDPKLTTIVGTSHCDEVTEGFYDTILYINVLEHIDDDVAELMHAKSMLSERGVVVVFGPNHPDLYSSVDARSGHYRRYTPKTLAAKMNFAGLDTSHTSVSDFIGALAYWVLYTKANKPASSGSIRFYDSVVVPLSKMCQPLAHLTGIGKNVVGVGGRPQHRSH